MPSLECCLRITIGLKSSVFLFSVFLNLLGFKSLKLLFLCPEFLLLLPQLSFDL